MQTITKRIIGITQILLLVFLGCGLSMAEEMPALDEAIPIAPFGVVETITPTYEWTSVPGATIYCLLVENIDGVPLYLAWYTDEEAGCMEGAEFCSVTPEYPVDEGFWSVLSCDGDECSRWSQRAQIEYVGSTASVDDELRFGYVGGGRIPDRPGPGPTFTDNGDGTVADNSAKLVWAKNASLGANMNWKEAMSFCDGLTLGGRTDWRLPTANELFKMCYTWRTKNPNDPWPFDNLRTGENGYWTSTTHGRFASDEIKVRVVFTPGSCIPWSTDIRLRSGINAWPVCSSK